MLHISLFSGIGGFDLASEWMGWRNIVSCEINPWANKVLSHYWPDAYHHEDIHSLNYDTINAELSRRWGSGWRNEDIILTGGFPCQPYSSAGKRLGTEDARHLWPEMCRLIREIQPAWIVGENVLGLANWNGGLVFHEVQTDLEAEGYEVQPFVLPAAGVNAPHRRDRIFFVAWNTQSNGETEVGKVLGERQGGEEGSDTIGVRSNISSNPKSKQSGKRTERERGEGIERGGTNNCGSSREESISLKDAIGDGRLFGEYDENGVLHRTQRNAGAGDTERVRREAMAGAAADTAITGREKRKQNGGWPDTKKDGTGLEFWAERFIDNGNAADPDREMLERRHGEGTTIGRTIAEKRTESFNRAGNWQTFPTQSPVCGGDDGLPAELDGITFSKWRNESIKGYGNAVVPPLVHVIFKAIEKYRKEYGN